MARYVYSDIVIFIIKKIFLAATLVLLRMNYLYLAPHKRDINKQCRPRSVAADQGLHSLHEIQEFLLNMVIILITSQTYCIGNGPVQRAMVEESTRHKLVNNFFSQTVT